MKKSILDSGNDVTLQEIIKFKSIKQLETVNFIEDLLDHESLVIANLSSACKNILLIGFESLKIPLLCIMNCSKNSKVNLLTKSERIINLFYQYNDQNNQISLREEMSTEDAYYEEINSSELYKDVLEVENLNKNKIDLFSQMNFDLSIIDLDSINKEENFMYFIQEHNVLQNIYLIKKNEEGSLEKKKNISFDRIKGTTLYIVRKS
jgi:hypothetical protein